MYDYSNVQGQNHLAWHETLELHELVAFQSIGLNVRKPGKVSLTPASNV